MRRACVRMRSSRDFTSRSVPSATPMRVSSPISRLRLAASARARAVSTRAAASRYPARTATSSCRVPVGWRTKPERSSAGISGGTSASPLRPRATIPPPASTKARSTSSGNTERLSESSTNTVGRSSTARSRGSRVSRISICAPSRAGRTLPGSQAGVCRRRYLKAPSRGLDALEARLGLAVVGEDRQRLLIHLDRLVLLPPVLVQQRPRVIRQRLGGNLPAHPLIRRLLRQGRQVRVLHQASRDVLDDLEQVVTLRLVLLDLHDLARLDAHEAGVDPKVAVEVDERAQHHVACADQLADFGRGLGVHAPRRSEILLLNQLLDLLALHHPGGRVRRQLRDEHACDALLQRVEVLPVLAVGAAVVERHHGDAGPGVLTPGLRREPAARGERDEAERQQCDDPTRTHNMLLDQRVSFIPSCAASTSPGLPFAFARRRAAASSPSMSLSPCSGSWWNSTSRRTPASAASATASSNVEWPHPRCSSSSGGVYIASWISSSVSARNATNSLCHDAGVP